MYAASSLLTGYAGNGLLLLLLPLQRDTDAGGRGGGGVGGELGGVEGWGGSDSSVTLTRDPPPSRNPPMRSGIAHPQCQKGEFICVALAAPGGCSGPPRLGSLLAAPPTSACSPPAGWRFIGVGDRRSHTHAHTHRNCDLHLSRNKHMAVEV